MKKPKTKNKKLTKIKIHFCQMKKKTKPKKHSNQISQKKKKKNSQNTKHPDK